MKLKELLDVIDDIQKVWIGLVDDDEELDYCIEEENRMLKFFLDEKILNDKVKNLSYETNDDDLDCFQIEIAVDKEVEQ